MKYDNFKETYGLCVPWYDSSENFKSKLYKLKRGPYGSAFSIALIKLVYEITFPTSFMTFSADQEVGYIFLQRLPVFFHSSRDCSGVFEWTL